MVRYLAIDEALQNEIKETLEHNNQSYINWCDLSDKKKIITRLNLSLHKIWAAIRDHLVGYMTPLVCVPSQSVGEVWG